MNKTRVLVSAVLLLLTGCTVNSEKTAAFEPVTASVIKTDQFGDVILDLEELNLSYGDSVNVSFSGGCSLESIPFYPDYYGLRGDTILTNFGDDYQIAGIRYSFNDTAQIKDGETATIELDERGKYKDLFEAYNVDTDKTPWEGQTNAEYMNARAVTAGNVKPDILYRSASPFEASFGRVELMDSFIQTYHIQCILDLADSEEDLHAFTGLPDNTQAMIDNDQVICFHIGNDFRDSEAMESIGVGLRKMLQKEGPYLVQCSLGRDRTGVLCALFEALCDATYDEIVEDYMVSYNLLHKVDINLEVDSDSFQYDLFKTRLDENLEIILKTDRDALATSDLKQKTIDYFLECGMTQDEVRQLTDILHE